MFGEHGDGSWERFIEEMNLCIESAVEVRGYEGEGGNRRLIMRNRAKLRPLLRAIGHIGEVLRGAGFDVDGANSAYEEAVEILQEYYGKQESMYVKEHKFLTARQALGESDREFLLRVESLSRYTEVANNADRVRFALIVSVNGLRNKEVSKDLMKNANLTWVMLKKALRAREMANHSDRFLRADSRGSDLESEIKKEIKRVSEWDSRAQYQSGGDREYDSACRYFPRSSPSSGEKDYWDNSDELILVGMGQEVESITVTGTAGSIEAIAWRGMPLYNRSNSREDSEDRVCYICKRKCHEMRSCSSIKSFSYGQ